MVRNPAYFLRETASAFRRNGLILIAAVSTVFIALFLLGGALLMQREVNLLVAETEANVQVAVYLSKNANPQEQQQILGVLNSMPQVRKPVQFESQQEAFVHFESLFHDQPIAQGVTPQDLPASFRVNLSDPTQFAAVAARLQGQPGIDNIVDNSTLYHRLFALTRAARIGFTVVAIIMLVSATGLIANTIRVAVFARRKEIEIMRLVGATNWTIRIPFILEGLIQGLIGAGVAIAGLFIMKAAFINPVRGLLQFLPIINTSQVLFVIPILVGVAIVVAVLASLIATRRFLEV